MFLYILTISQQNSSIYPSTLFRPDPPGRSPSGYRDTSQTKACSAPDRASKGISHREAGSLGSKVVPVRMACHDHLSCDRGVYWISRLVWEIAIVCPFAA